MTKKLFAAVMATIVSAVGIGLCGAAAASAAPTEEPAVPAVKVAKPIPSGMAVQHAGCGFAATDIDAKESVSTGGGANIRSGSSTSCAIYGQAGSGDALDYYCFTVGNDGFTWTYLRNITDGTNGWVRDDLLADNGSTAFCTTLV
jgi:hypothetical protein